MRKTLVVKKNGAQRSFELPRSCALRHTSFCGSMDGKEEGGERVCLCGFTILWTIATSV